MKRELRKKLKLNRETLQNVSGGITLKTFGCTGTCKSCFVQCDPAWTMSCPSPRPCTYSLPPCPM